MLLSTDRCSLRECRLLARLAEAEGRNRKRLLAALEELRTAATAAAADATAAAGAGAAATGKGGKGGKGKAKPDPFPLPPSLLELLAVRGVVNILVDYAC